MFRKLFGKQDEKTQDELKLEQSLQKTRSGILGRISTLFQENEITEELWEELEETLIAGDVGMAVTIDLVATTRRRIEAENIKSTRDAYQVLKQEMVKLLQSEEPLHIDEVRLLTVVLVVGVNSDQSVRKLKGATRPVIKEHDRAALLAALACVDHVLVFDEDTPEDILRALRPDVLVKGGTYAPDQVVGHEIVSAYGGRVCVTGMVDGVSTTRILDSLAARDAPGVSAALPSAGEPLKGPHFLDNEINSGRNRTRIEDRRSKQ